MSDGDVAAAETAQEASAVPRLLLRACYVFGIVFAVALFGILTRPASHLAVFWIANAVLLGIFLRRPEWASIWGWIAAVIGYLAADLLTGGSWDKSILLTGANLVGVITGYVLFSFLDEPDRRLQRPMSVFYMCVIVTAASAMSGVVGGIASPIVFGGTAIDGFYFWFVAEIVNFVAVLPVILTMPRWSRQGFMRPLEYRTFIARGEFWPLVALVISCLMGMLVGGPGAMAFPVPALLWCAVSFSLFPTTILSFMFSAWVVMSMSAGYLPVSGDVDSLDTLLSLRLGVTLIALAPLTVASVMSGRNDLLCKLEQAAHYDQLTGALRRDAFYFRVEAALSEPAGSRHRGAMMMFDIDRFKEVNDNFGHDVGDSSLMMFAAVARVHIGPHDLFGRLGGEEFAIFLLDRSRDEAVALADRIRTDFAATGLPLDDGRTVHVTVSGGIANCTSNCSVLGLLKAADRALYQAKKHGRDNVQLADAPLLGEPNRP